jgi:soluble lytic murein transglycosylase-like protein
MAAPLGGIPPGFKFYKDLIAKYAMKYSLEPAMVAALIWQESAFCANAYRFEPDFWNRYLKANERYRQLNPARVSASYGLMQIMYPLVHEDRLKENDTTPPEFLFEPEINLNTGCGWAKQLYDWALTKTTDPAVASMAALAAYNGGRGGNDPSKDNPLRNGRYAREVMARVPIMRAQYAGIAAPQPRLTSHG